MLLTFVPFGVGAGLFAASGADLGVASSWPFWLLSAGAVACLEIGHRTKHWTHR